MAEMTNQEKYLEFFTEDDIMELPEDHILRELYAMYGIEVPRKILYGLSGWRGYIPNISSFKPMQYKAVKAYENRSIFEIQRLTNLPYLTIKKIKRELQEKHYEELRKKRQIKMEFGGGEEREDKDN